MQNLTTLVFGIFVLISNSCTSQTKNESLTSMSNYLNENDITIRQAITDNIFNLNPVEYAYALPELCQLIKENIIPLKKWKYYIDSLNIRSKKIDSDTLISIYAINTKGLLQKQIHFFVSSINSNPEFSNKYAKEIRDILKNTSIESSKELTETSLKFLKISDVIGETNFWYFLQIDGCSLIDRIVKDNVFSQEALKIISANLNIVTTFKSPYSLQKRKLKDMQSRLIGSGNSFCTELSNLMNKRVITIEDKNKNYFKEHSDWYLVKTF